MGIRSRVDTSPVAQGCPRGLKLRVQYDSHTRANRHGAGIFAPGDADCNRAACTNRASATSVLAIPKRFPTESPALCEWKIAPHTTSGFFRCPVVVLTAIGGAQ